MTETYTPLHVHIARAATRSGPPVLLVHGFLSNGAHDWPDANWSDAITAQGRDVLVVDLPAHGQGAAVSDPAQARVAAVAAALEKVAASTGEAVDVIGYSLGARLAWALAAQHPGRVNRLVLGGLGLLDPFAPVDFAAARQLAEAGEAPADPHTGFLASLVIGSGADAASMFNFMEGLAADPFDPAREAPTAQLLFIAGTDDPMAAKIDTLEPYVPGSRTLRVPGDHMAALRTPAFREAALTFLGLAA